MPRAVIDEYRSDEKGVKQFCYLRRVGDLVIRYQQRGLDGFGAFAGKRTETIDGNIPINISFKTKILSKHLGQRCRLVETGGNDRTFPEEGPHPGQGLKKFDTPLFDFPAHHSTITLLF